MLDWFNDWWHKYDYTYFVNKQINHSGVTCAYEDYSSFIYKYRNKEKYLTDRIQNLKNNEIFIFAARDKDGNPPHQMCVAKIQDTLFGIGMYNNFIKYFNISQNEAVSYSNEFYLVHLKDNCFGDRYHITIGANLQQTPRYTDSEDCQQKVKKVMGYPCVFHSEYFSNFMKNVILEYGNKTPAPTSSINANENVNIMKEIKNKIKDEFKTGGPFEQACVEKINSILVANKKEPNFTLESVPSIERKNSSPTVSIATPEQKIEEQKSELLSYSLNNVSIC
jgi:hypothetical protein